jgi:hypothetical protein
MMVSEITAFIVLLLLISIAVEAVTEIITSSELTRPSREWWKKYTYKIDEPPDDSIIQKFKVWFDKLISCGYCTSVWVAASFAAVLPKPEVGNIFTSWCLVTFVTHRIATWLHVVYEIIRKGRVQSIDLDITLRETGVDNGSFRESQSEESASFESVQNDATDSGENAS